MTTPPRLAYFGNDWFADNRTSSHHVARQLAKRTSVLYFECPGLRPPSGTGRDLRRMATKVVRGLKPAVDTAEGVRVKTLLQWPAHGSPVIARFNRIWARATIGLTLPRSDARHVAWCTVPHVAGFVTRLRAAAVVYHCIDDYAALPGVDVDAVRAMDERLAREADLVITASQPVFEAKRALNPDTILMPHGVDYAHFASARQPLNVPDEIAGLEGPIVGFFGLIERWIDVDLVGWLAQQMPQATFLMIGRVAVPRESLPQAANIRWMGPRPYESLPQYGRRFDAAIIPYRDTAQVRAANPLKLREYLAMGMPIVSVGSPEIERFSNVLHIARDRDEFLAGLQSALREGSGSADIERRMTRARESDWSTWTDTALGHLQRILDDRAPGDAR